MNIKSAATSIWEFEQAMKQHESQRRPPVKKEKKSRKMIKPTKKPTKVSRYQLLNPGAIAEPKKSLGSIFIKVSGDLCEDSGFIKWVKELSSYNEDITICVGGGVAN